MTRRILLTLLALLTGLSVQQGAVHARAVPEAAAQVAAAAAQAAAHDVIAEPVTAAEVAKPQAANVQPNTQPVRLAASVRIRIDRAHE